MYKYKQQTGFTLMEILVAIVVLSIGLLGIAGLQMQGTRHVHDAQLHTLAAIQAEDMADRMRDVSYAPVPDISPVSCHLW